jgi:hypothetical protein
MTKQVRKARRNPASPAAPSKGRPAAVAPKSTAAVPTKTTSKQARVLEMLGSATGTTIAGMMQETGWQQHSVRGFLAGVVRKRLGLNLQSKKVDGKRTYRIGPAAQAKPQTANKKRRV